MSKKGYPQHQTEVTKSLNEHMAISIDKGAIRTFKIKNRDPDVHHPSNLFS
jgi:hypothetical protein